ncbi:hypothetical protein ABMA28_010090 [Loxostege sticticalis]|uniref:UDP-glucuronosyltransferase n=1 Tax=Loxostege sticticalis TaxID=481309 RepID=A0ABD0SBT7_LOXSC
MSRVSCFILILIVLSCYIIQSDAAKILAYFPTPCFSHQVVFRSLTEELARRGHEVTVITTDPEFTKTTAPANLNEVDVHDLSYSMWREHFLKTSTGNKDDLYNQITVIHKIMNEIIEKQLLSKEVKEVIDLKNKYDLVIIEAFPRHLLILSHLFKVPMILFSSFGSSFINYHTFGAPTHELLYPDNIRQRLYNLTMWEKVIDLYNVHSIKHFYDRFEDNENAMLRRVFGDVPSIDELKNNVDLLFLNIHPIWEGIRPVPRSVVHIRGINEKPEKQLPTDLKTYLDSSKNGVIYISFGTNVKPSLLPPERIKNVVNVMSALPYDVLLKWDKDVLEGKSNNIKLANWLPQSDLLRHPKIKLFITQGGLQSTDEAINAGVPLIGIPMHGDQWYNVEQYSHFKIGMKLDWETMTEETLKDAVTKVIEDKSYRQNVIDLRNLMNDHPQPPLERAVRWTEYVIRHSGARHLRAPAANMPWHQYYELELVSTVLSIFIIGLMILVLVIVQLFKIVKKVIAKETKVKSN